MVFKMTDTPGGSGDRVYERRGWTALEQRNADLVSQWWSSLDVSPRAWAAVAELRKQAAKNWQTRLVQAREANKLPPKQLKWLEDQAAGYAVKCTTFDGRFAEMGEQELAQ